jgi:tRNA (guanine-N7-)-methyltransferase
LRGILNNLLEVGKNKLERWAELKTFNNVVQTELSFPAGSDHYLKGNWNAKIFGNKNPIILELACGKGEHTLGFSELFPDCNFIGVDIKGARIWRGAKTANEKRLDNVAFLRTRIEFIDSYFAKDEVDEIWLTFPDPHPGKNNSNKRLTCPWFMNKYRDILKDGGIIHLKTDNEELFSYTMKIVKYNELELLCSSNDLESVPVIIPTEMYFYPSDKGYLKKTSDGILSIKTFYESKFTGEGMKIFYLAFRLNNDKLISYGWGTTG